MRLLPPGPAGSEMVHEASDPRVHLFQEPHYGELGDVAQPLPSEVHTQHQMKVPVTIGVCKMCRRVYRPEVSGQTLFVSVFLKCIMA